MLLIRNPHMLCCVQLLTFETGPVGGECSHLYTMHVNDNVKGQPNSTWVVVSGGVGRVLETRSVIIHKCFSPLGKWTSKCTCLRHLSSVKCTVSTATSCSVLFGAPEQQRFLCSPLISYLAKCWFKVTRDKHVCVKNILSLIRDKCYL